MRCAIRNLLVSLQAHRLISLLGVAYVLNIWLSLVQKAITVARLRGFLHAIIKTLFFITAVFNRLRRLLEESSHTDFFLNHKLTQIKAK